MIKSTVLTEEEKKKLLEMAKFFCPSVEWHFWESDCEKDNLFLGYNKTYIVESDVQPYKDGLSIHWLEFCLYYLTVRIKSRINYVLKRDYLTETLWRDMLESYNPVDYLYQIFESATKE